MKPLISKIYPVTHYLNPEFKYIDSHHQDVTVTWARERHRQQLERCRTTGVIVELEAILKHARKQ
jgi:hypothetical protein